MQQQIHAADAEHGVVEIKAVEQAVVEVLRKLAAEDFGVMRAQVLARPPGNPVPEAGSQTTSVGWGAVISTMSRMMWHGVRNWPFCPALAILPSMYS